MFERFTGGARAVVVGAQAQARALGHDEILAEDLLLAVLADGRSVGAQVLRDLGVDQERLAREVAAFGERDDAALRAIGIDLAAIRHRVESTFGTGALDRPRRRRVGLLRRVLRAGGHLRFSTGAKQALEQSLRQAIDLHHNDIGPDHVLLGLIATDQDPASQTLRRLGVDPADVRARVRALLHRAA